MIKILVIDDEQDICMLLERFLKKKGFDCEAVSDEVYGFNLIKKNKYDLVITDLRLPTINGIELLKKIKTLSPSTKVIIITGYSDINTAVQAMKYGAVDYVSKPLYPDEILSTINTALAEEKSKDIDKTVKKADEVASKPQGDSKTYVLGDSSSSKKVMDNINLVAPTDMSIVIMGETGTGKEYVAKEIHNRSDRANKPFFAIDCGALPVDIAASEFFGHVKGSFTGAVADKSGIFELANGGTLFLDEVGNLSYDIQVKLLRVLQERVFRKVGGAKDIQTDVRVLAATNENLRASSTEKSFRQDLYFRLNEFSISVPALRNRKEDILVFANFFREIANDSLKKKVQSFNSETEGILLNYSWPGNLRELKNVVKRAVLIATTDTITKNCLPEEILYDFNPGPIVHESQVTNLKSAAESAEIATILKVLAETGNNKTKAAQILNIDRKTLYNKLNAYKESNGKKG